MASSRRTGARSPRARRTARSSAPSSPPLVWIGSLALAAVVVLLVFVMNGSSANAAGEKSSAKERSTPRTADAADPGEMRTGSVPTTPAPAIPDSVWTEGDALYDRAADLWNEGQGHRKAGRTDEYQKALLASWDELEKLTALIEPYTDWFEHADLEGWAMPADYGRLQQRLEVWDPLRAKVRKLKPVKPR